MHRYSSPLLWLQLGVMGTVALFTATFADEPAVRANPSEQNATDVAKLTEPAGDAIHPVSLAVARDRAKLLQDVYMSTLEVIHERYFHGDRVIVPARAMEAIFMDVKRHNHIDARWISVNLKAMSLDHEPQSEFEKFAATEIAKGAKEVERVEEGKYYRATAISLSGGCVTCHVSFSQQASTSKKFAGLVLRIPIQNETPVEADARSHK